MAGRAKVERHQAASKGIQHETLEAKAVRAKPAKEDSVGLAIGAGRLGTRQTNGMPTRHI